MKKTFLITEEEKNEILGLYNLSLLNEQAGYTPAGSKYQFKNEASYNDYNSLNFTKATPAWTNLYGPTISGFRQDTNTFDASPGFIANVILMLAMAVGNKKSVLNYGNWDTFKTTLMNPTYFKAVSELSGAKGSTRFKPAPDGIIATIENSKSNVNMAKDESGKNLGVTQWQKFVTDQVQPVWQSRYTTNVIQQAEPIKKP